MIERLVGQRVLDSWSSQIQVRRLEHQFGKRSLTNTDSAASAVRNLNDYEIMNRKLRVDFSNDGGEEESVSMLRAKQRLR